MCAPAGARHSLLYALNYAFNPAIRISVAATAPFMAPRFSQVPTVHIGTVAHSASINTFSQNLCAQEFNVIYLHELIEKRLIRKIGLHNKW